ncbi:MAG: GYD domain-containing protein [Chloroflexi bacterium]|nr:GYD domain-containing protein [Chloroflexota bacterium]MBT5476354.1 GYD domain-containing protein [Chloroflexota bacterium]MBT6707073.1 GYD domain-containing protein [Chloroflexota bacterium]MBT7003738.1 GYD domain-containing protein [Chloroflexota bacterium]
MPYYLMLSKLTERGRDRIKHNPDRITQVNLEIEEQDCSVVSQYALLGRYDFATLIEAPDNAHMSRLAVDLGARGTTETETLPAEPTELFIEAMKGK